MMQGVEDGAPAGPEGALPPEAAAGGAEGALPPEAVAAEAAPLPGGGEIVEEEATEPAKEAAALLASIK